MRLNAFGYLPDEEVEYRDLHPWVEIFADRFRVCKDCPSNLADRAREYCAMKNQRSNDQVCRAYRARLLP